MGKNKDLILRANEAGSVEEMELMLTQSEARRLLDQEEKDNAAKDLTTSLIKSFRGALTQLIGKDVSEVSSSEKIPAKYFYEAVDSAYGRKENLIRPSHEFRPFSLLKARSGLKDIVPYTDGSVLFNTLAGYQIRSTEIMHEFSSENTSRAFNGDLIYWQAWLSAIGFQFTSPITSAEIKTFIIQHAEGLPIYVDRSLVSQRYKQNLGIHEVSTIKRRLASLSVFLDLEKWHNPTRDFEVRKLLEKITKKYGGTKRKGLAITKDTLFALLETCGDALIDARDRAVLLFGWSSGGRRRAEIAQAEIEDLQEVGENYVYHMKKSKTDQKGRGVTLPLNGVAAMAVRDWINRANIVDGRIFRSVSKGDHIGEKITDVDINRIVKKRCKRAGFDPSLYSAHSLRSGFITEAGRRGCAIGDTMALSTHKSIPVFMGYYQAGSVSNNSAANLMS